MTKEQQCPLCGEYVPTQLHQTEPAFVLYLDARCGPYYLHDTERNMYLTNEVERAKQQPERLGQLLKERELNGEPRPVLFFDEKAPENIDDAVPVRAQDLLLQWPESVPERFERSFLAFVREAGKGVAGVRTQIKPEQLREYVPLALNDAEQNYFLDTMVDRKWITPSKNRNPRNVVITLLGWERYEELTRQIANRRNPIFVAMWFGAPDRKTQMNEVFKQGIEPACIEAGWSAKRADTDEHNDPIMDKVLYDIRKAPFLIADLTNNNQGVYYEAGFAQGPGKTVIYCCPKGSKPHFDVAGINLVMWDDVEHLKKRLADRILGTMGEGPFFKES